MDRNTLLPTLVFLAISTAATPAFAGMAEADVLRLNYQRGKVAKPVSPQKQQGTPMPKGDTTASTKLGHR